jgi:hypothetical protein
VTPISDVGCWGDECHHDGWRDCYCHEVQEAIRDGLVSPATNPAGEYCKITMGHCHAPNPSGGCNTGTEGVLGKIYPNPVAPFPANFYQIPGVTGVDLCDQTRPTPHSGSPYGANRCCY